MAKTFEDSLGLASALGVNSMQRPERPPSLPVTPRRAADAAGAAIAAPAAAHLVGLIDAGWPAPVGPALLAGAAGLGALVWTGMLTTAGEYLPAVHRVRTENKVLALLLLAGVASIAGSAALDSAYLLAAGAWIVASGTSCVLVRLGARRPVGSRVLILGAGAGAREAAARLLEPADPPVLPVAFVDAAKAGSVVVSDRADGSWLAMPVVGSGGSLPDLAQRFAADRVIVAPCDEVGGVGIDDVVACSERGVEVTTAALVLEQIAARIFIPSCSDDGLVDAAAAVTSSRRGTYHGAKRAADLVLAAAAILLTSPVLAGAIGALRIASPGPALVRVPHLGRHGVVFGMWTFAAPERNPRGGCPIAFRRFAARLARGPAGRLPTLANVLAGHMSFVGPRADPGQAEAGPARERIRRAVRPGLAGWAELITTRQATDHAARPPSLDRLEFDLYYLKHRSLLLDVQILIRTIVATFGPRPRKRAQSPAA